ncbi:MAG: hypothetical protein MUF62_11695 [Chitinophagaceae bacterium]|jgi:hypothetical protein|nr:hypothetical protein [Chitinophagaceae bacterium]
MQSQTLILGHQISLTTLPALVKYSNKYSTGTGMYGFHLFISQTATDIVFRLPRTGTDCHFTVAGNDLPIYPDQEVELIIANDMIIGFIDQSTRRYYYLVDGFSKLFGIQPWVWLMGLVVGISVLVSVFFIPGEYQQLGFLVALLVVIFSFLYRRGLNWFIERKLDAAIEGDDNKQWH